MEPGLRLGADKLGEVAEGELLVGRQRPHYAAELRVLGMPQVEDVLPGELLVVERALVHDTHQLAVEIVLPRDSDEVGAGRDALIARPRVASR